MRKLKLEELGRVSIEEFKVQKKTPLVIVLDNVRSALNVGSVFRTADSFAVEKIYLCGITATPPHKEISKSAIGATDSVNWEHVKDISDAINNLKSNGYKILGVEQTSQTTLLQDVIIDSNQKIAIVMGNEVMGISDAILPLLDEVIEIPQFGTKHSLNVSVCTGIVVWEVFRKMVLK